MKRGFNIYAYHIDRSNSKHFQPGDNLVINKSWVHYNETNVILEEQFPEGLTSHGRRYLTNSIDPYKPWNNFYETIFEYERKINFPNLTSRFQVLFAVEFKQDIAYWEDILKLNGDVAIWKVSVQEENVFRADASWLNPEDFDQSVLRISYNARQYWSGKPRPGHHPLPELLISGPMQLVELVHSN